MKEKQRYYSENLLLGVLTVVICITVGQWGHNFKAIECMLTMLTMGLAIGTKLTITQYTSVRVSNVLNSIALYSLYIRIFILFSFYLSGVGELGKLNLRLVWVCSGSFDIVTSLIILFLVNKGIRTKVANYAITICFIMITLTTYKLLKNSMMIENYMKIITVLTIIPHSIYLFVIRKKCEADFGKGINAFTCFALCRIVEYFCIFFLRSYLHLTTVCFALHCVENYYLLVCALTSCIEEPLTEKLNALNEAEDQIHNHNKTSKMIVNLSHELKTPVNVIRSATDLLILDYQNEVELNQDIKSLKGECNQVMNVIQTMIDIQKIKGREIVEKYGDHNIVELFENVVEAFSYEYKGSSLIFNPKEEEIEGYVDAQLLQQAFIQLVVTMIQWDAEQSIYIEMCIKKEKMIQISLYHSSVNEIQRLLAQLVSFEQEEKMIHMLNIQFLQEVIDLHRGSVKCVSSEKKMCIEISLPLRIEQEEIIGIDERNTLELRELIRHRYLVG